MGYCKLTGGAASSSWSTEAPPPPAESCVGVLTPLQSHAASIRLLPASSVLLCVRLSGELQVSTP